MNVINAPGLYYYEQKRGHRIGLTAESQVMLRVDI